MCFPWSAVVRTQTRRAFIHLMPAPLASEPPRPVHQRSPVSVHHTEGKGEAGRNLLKLFLRNVPILVMIVVLEDGLGGKKRSFFGDYQGETNHFSLEPNDEGLEHLRKASPEPE